VLSVLRDKQLISDDDVAQILGQEHSGFNVWPRPELGRTVRGDPFQNAESERFVARYIEQMPFPYLGAVY